MVYSENKLKMLISRVCVGHKNPFHNLLKNFPTDCPCTAGHIEGKRAPYSAGNDPRPEMIPIGKRDWNENGTGMKSGDWIFVRSTFITISKTISYVLISLMTEKR